MQTELPVEPAHFGMEHLSAATNYMSKVLGMATGRDPSTETVLAEAKTSVLRAADVREMQEALDRDAVYRHPPDSPTSRHLRERSKAAAPSAGPAWLTAAPAPTPAPANDVAAGVARAFTCQLVDQAYEATTGSPSPRSLRGACRRALAAQSARAVYGPRRAHALLHAWAV